MSNLLTRVTTHLNQFLFIFALAATISGAAWLTSQHHYQWDWTSGSRNSLSQSSQLLLERLDGVISITVYASDKKILRARIRESLTRYQRYKNEMTVRFVEPNSVPDEIRQLGVTTDGEIRIEYAGQVEHVTAHTEQEITNALIRVARAGERWIAFLTGHGERDMLGKANHDLGSFGDALKLRGYRVQPITLTEVLEIPSNTALLVIAGPRVAVLREETEKINAFMDRGGNLLWLTDPGPLWGLEELAGRLGVELVPGQIVDPNTPLFGVDQPTFPVVSRYPSHPVTADFDLITLYPESVALTLTPGNEWDSSPLIKTDAKTWSETSASPAPPVFDSSTDHPGPLTLGVALQSKEANTMGAQRIVVMGDGDFLSNAYLGNGGNLELGLSIVNWLSHDDQFIALPAKTAPDLTFYLSKTGALLLAIGSLFLAPAALFATGILIWWKRH